MPSAISLIFVSIKFPPKGQFGALDASNDKVVTDSKEHVYVELTILHQPPSPDIRLGVPGGSCKAPVAALRSAIAPSHAAVRLIGGMSESGRLAGRLGARAPLASSAAPRGDFGAARDLRDLRGPQSAGSVGAGRGAGAPHARYPARAC